jgi:hypothetical protein
LQKRLFQTRCSAARLNGVAVLHGRLNTVQALGLIVPPALLAAADRVID